MKKLMVRMDDTLYAALKAKAGANGMNRAAIQALTDWVGGEKADASRAVQVLAHASSPEYVRASIPGNVLARLKPASELMGARCGFHGCGSKVGLRQFGDGWRCKEH